MKRSLRNGHRLFQNINPAFEGIAKENDKRTSLRINSLQKRIPEHRTTQ
jgi:hypothetical protein